MNQQIKNTLFYTHYTPYYQEFFVQNRDKFFLPFKEYGFIIKSTGEFYTRNFYFRTKQEFIQHILKNKIVSIHHSISDFEPFLSGQNKKTLKAKKLLFDFDAKIDFEKYGFTKKAYSEIITTILQFCEIMKRYFNIEPEIRFSGMKGFHVYFSTLTSNEAARILKIIMDLENRETEGLAQEFKAINLYSVLDHSVRQDENKLIRSLGSLHQKTGIPCQIRDLFSPEWWIFWPKSEKPSDKIWINMKTEFQIQISADKILSLKRGLNQIPVFLAPLLFAFDLGA
jgi:DNA primase catalytic subunit